MGNKEPVCIADEVPFEIPESWEWVKLSSVVYFVGNKHNQILAKEVKSDGVIPAVSQGASLIDGYCDNISKAIADIPVVIFGDHTRNVKYIDFRFVISADGTKIMRPFAINIKYLYYWMIYASEHLHNRGYARHYSLLAEQFVPLPPKNEQARIVSKIEAVLPFIKKYGDVELTLSTMEGYFPDKLKKSILQLAVQGKLAPQDPNDEPASVLLERIRVEKEKLFKAGKIKRDKHESVIYRRDNSHYEMLDGVERCIDDEIPFEIPESWEWTRFASVIFLLSGADFKPEEYNDSWEGIPYITGASSLSADGVIVSRWTEYPRNIANNGDILLVCKGSGYGKTVFCDVAKAHIARQIMAIKKSRNLDMRYVRYFLQMNISYLKSCGQGVIPGIDRETVLCMLFPLPPLNEQHRIVSELDRVFSIIPSLDA